MIMSSRIARLPMIVLGLGLALSACAKDPNQSLDGANGLNGAGGMGPPGSRQEFASAAVGDRIWFDTDSSEVNAKGQDVLNKQAQWLRQYSQYSASIEGHADERGTDQYNFSLGAKRAAAVQAYLAARGVPANRLKTTSFGKTRPVQQCNEGDDACQSQNRRAVTVLGGQ